MSKTTLNDSALKEAHAQLKKLTKKNHIYTLTVGRVDYQLMVVADAYQKLLKLYSAPEFRDDLVSLGTTGYDLMIKAMLHAGEAANKRIKQQSDPNNSMPDKQILESVKDRLRIWKDFPFCANYQTRIQTLIGS